MYEFFGLRVQSPFELPIAGVVSDDGEVPDITFAWGDPTDPRCRPIGEPVSSIRCDCPLHNGQPILQVFRDDGHTWIWHHNAGVIHVDPVGSFVRVYADVDRELDERLLGLLLVGLASTFVLHQRGVACLHGSAVRIGDDAIAFLGPKGQGKSTMAAGFLRQGATLLTDDVLPLCESDSGIEGVPSLPMMKLWGQSVTGALELDHEFPNLTANLNKKLFTLDDRFGFASSATRLRAFYVLERYEPLAAGSEQITIEPLSQRDGLMALVTQTTLGPYLSTAEMAKLLPLYSRLLVQAPVRCVRFPNGFEHQQRVQHEILADALGADRAAVFVSEWPSNG
jgi:hypothetical protein